MPYEKDPLSESEIELIEEWIDQGAHFETHWAYIPPDIGIEPPSIHSTWIKSEIDAFILQKLNELALQPNAEADKAHLLRRLSLDLIGLPPSEHLMDSFMNDSSEWAYSKVVDSLLASPHFGERWASWWLDLARYADSKGYEKDLYRSIWKYRDWVIQAFNEDMPFDQFTIEQLAGDLLPDPDEKQLIATAFHRNTMANDEGGTDNEEFRNYANIERVGTTFEVWQATTMSCVQCHSHPYDPFRQEDFYSFMAFFNNTADRDIYHEGPNVFTYEGEDKEKIAEIVDWLNQHLEEIDKPDPDTFLHVQKTQILYKTGYRKLEAEHFDNSSSFIELTAPHQNEIFQIQDTSWIMYEQVDLTDIEAITYRYATPYSGFIEVRLGSQHGPIISHTSLPPTAIFKTPNRWEHRRELKVPIEKAEGKHDLYFVFKKDRHQTQNLFQIDWIYLHEKNPRLASYASKVKEKVFELAAIKPTPTPIFRELPPGKRRKNYVFERGNWLTHGEEVEESIPEALGELSDPSIPNRLDMAQWLVSKENPLTARVTVNRLWEQIFGYGIIETVEDFGTQGIAPTNSKLLDWLAVQLRDKHEWSIKSLLKEMVLSAAYRQSSQVDSIKLDKDPRNLYLSRGPRIRMSAEQLRDQVLVVSGLFNPELYGPSVRPPLPEGAGRFGFGDRWVLSDTSDWYRRSLYTYIKRTQTFPNRITFDGTDRTTCTSRRIRTNTPLQALTLLNDPALMEAAKKLGACMHEAAQAADQKIASGYKKVMLKEISDKKLDHLMDLYYDSLQYYEDDPEAAQSLLVTDAEADIELAALTMVANALLNLDEFITK